MMQKFSPNWYWNEIGCTIHRNGFLRTIHDKNGEEVCHNAGYETEIGICEWLFYGAIIYKEQSEMLSQNYHKKN